MAIKLTQTAIVAGQPSTVTLEMADANGNPVRLSFVVPPGPPLKLPDNLATLDDVSQFLAGNLNLGPNDLRGSGLCWDGGLGNPRFSYGDPNTPVTSHLLGTNQSGNYLCANGNAVLQIQAESDPVSLQRFYVTATNGLQISFPKPFASDNNVRVLVNPRVVNSDKGPEANICQIDGTPDRYGFKISIYQASSNMFNSGAVPVDIIATGPAAATV